MIYLWASILVLVNAACLLLNLLGLPGNWLMLACTFLVAWWKWSDGIFSIGTLLAVLVLAVIGEVLELLTGVLGARAAGSSRRGAAGALIGGLAGTIAGTFIIPIPVLGSLAGACGGACIGAWLLELSTGRRLQPAMRSGFGAGAGTLVGRTIKLAIGIIIWLTIAVAAFVP
jgi:uncharacterized protein YqgC (DUF456 family)